MDGQKLSLLLDKIAEFYILVDLRLRFMLFGIYLGII